nr:GreA/GreB family elongation factor [uncultured Flavobacterium sp.]
MKQQVLQYYKQLVQDRIDVFQDMISGLTVDAQNDAKGSAGDKHETALSMMHLEQEKLNHKLKEILEQKAILDKIDASLSTQKVALGSLVKSNGMWLFISAALPKITINDQTIFALSPQSPLGSQLMGNQVGDSVSVNGKNYTIESIS